MVGGSSGARVLAVALSLAGGCRQAADQPEQALERFLAAVAAGRADEAWGALSSASKAALLARHEALARAGGRDATAASPAETLFEELDLRLLAQPESVVVVSPLGNTVTLRVTVKDGPSTEIRMVREERGWSVDLESALKPAP